MQTKKLNLKSIFNINEKDCVEKTHFCSFVVSNGNCKERNKIFEKISKYKKVDSAGILFNNTGSILPRNESSQLHKFNFLKNRKFNICYENSSYPGYVTEKIFHSFFCKSIPIYWGSPTVELDFNIKAFISRHEFKNDEEMIEKIIEIDNDEKLYDEMTSQPIFNERNKYFNLNKFNEWFLSNVYKGEIN